MDAPINQEELLNRGLPKWPQMLVTGTPVTVEQAKEIIFRTDRFLTDASEHSGGNEREFNAEYRKAAGLDRFPDKELAQLREHFAFAQFVRENVGYIETEYVDNNWASSYFIFGAHGWCHPDGTISYVDNVGKWPSVESVLNDWKRIAEAFPFLSLTATLMSGEESEDREPVVNIVVGNGQAWLEPGDLTPHLDAEGKPPRGRYDEEDSIVAGFNERKELGLPSEWYDEFAERVRAIAEKYS